MNWLPLQTETELEDIIKKSASKPQVILKHSTRCSISVMAKGRLDKEESNAADFYLLDLLNFRSISNKIAEQFAVHHESPQVLVIKNGDCVYTETHNGIYFEEIEEQLIAKA
jgi:bacillithiol system protein YtxJ